MGAMYVGKLFRGSVLPRGGEWRENRARKERGEVWHAGGEEYRADGIGGGLAEPDRRRSKNDEKGRDEGVWVLYRIRGVCE